MWRREEGFGSFDSVILVGEIHSRKGQTPKIVLKDLSPLLSRFSSHHTMNELVLTKAKQNQPQ